MRFSASLLQETHSVLPEINKQKQSHSMQAENAWIQSFENLCTTAQTQRQERPLPPLSEKSCIILWAGLMSLGQGLEKMDSASSEFNTSGLLLVN